MPGPDGIAEGDTDQLPSEDTLYSRGSKDLLDEGYSPPDRPRTNHWGETSWEERHGESMDQRLSEEEPDVWQADPLARADTSRAGRLVADPDADPGSYAAEDGTARTTCTARTRASTARAASAEEAAVHWVEEL